AVHARQVRGVPEVRRPDRGGAADARRGVVGAADARAARRAEPAAWRGAVLDSLSEAFRLRGVAVLRAPHLSSGSGWMYGAEAIRRCTYGFEIPGFCAADRRARSEDRRVAIRRRRYRRQHRRGDRPPEEEERVADAEY